MNAELLFAQYKAKLQRERALELTVADARYYISQLDDLIERLENKICDLSNALPEKGQERLAPSILLKVKVMHDITEKLYVDKAVIQNHITLNPRDNFTSLIKQSVKDIRYMVASKQKQVKDDSWFNRNVQEPVTNFFKNIANFFGFKPIFSTKKILNDLQDNFEENNITLKI